MEFKRFKLPARRFKPMQRPRPKRRPVRKSYFYYGRVKWLAEGVREGGLLFMREERRGSFAPRRNEKTMLE